MATRTNGPSDGVSGRRKFEADPNGLFAALDVTSAVARQKIANTLPGFLKRFTEKVKIQITATTATTAVAGDINLTVWYVVD